VLCLDCNKYPCTKNLIAPFSLSIYYNMPTTQIQDVEIHTHTHTHTDRHTPTWPQSVILCPMEWCWQTDKFYKQHKALGQSSSNLHIQEHLHPSCPCYALEVL